SFMPAAPRIVRMERAVRPCLPMTFPRSLGATFSSSTVTCSPSTSLTETSCGISTRAFAISSINCLIRPPPGPIVTRSRVKERPRTSSLQGFLVMFLTFRRACGNGLGGRLCGWILFDETFDGIGELGAVLGPVLDAVVLQQNLGRVGGRVVGADHFNVAAVASPLLFNHDYTIEGLLFGAETRQTNH